ncbi:hypothetical protein GCM10022232_56250 [Streptomyces plumbiresistens]|uniref:Uncharacterized protein n=1 Tax=Streptomyces plumbiresistens TaxID=511811 RepID=A0ABP7S9Q0_9ACTN
MNRNPGMPVDRRDVTHRPARRRPSRDALPRAVRPGSRHRRPGRPQEVDGTAWLNDLGLSPKHREVLYETYCTGRSTRVVALARP